MQNYGDAIVAISQYQNASDIEVSIQEGKYVDERFQITFTAIDKIPMVINDPNNVIKGSVILLESVPAILITYSKLRVVSKKCKAQMFHSIYRMFFPSHYFNKL